LYARNSSPPMCFWLSANSLLLQRAAPINTIQLPVVIDPKSGEETPFISYAVTLSSLPDELLNMTEELRFKASIFSKPYGTVHVDGKAVKLPRGAAEVEDAARDPPGRGIAWLLREERKNPLA